MPRSSTQPARADGPVPDDLPLSHRNEILLVGRMSGDPVERQLPSGDVIVTWRLVVARPPAESKGVEQRRSAVDALECQAQAAGLRRTALRLRDGDVVHVEGALRRRFYRAGAATLSQHEVVAAHVRRLDRPAEPVRARPRAKAAPPSTAPAGTAATEAATAVTTVGEAPRAGTAATETTGAATTAGTAAPAPP